jgi:hypothetical protein
MTCVDLRGMQTAEAMSTLSAHVHDVQHSHDVQGKQCAASETFRMKCSVKHCCTAQEACCGTHISTDLSTMPSLVSECYIVKAASDRAHQEQRSRRCAVMRANQRHAAIDYVDLLHPAAGATVEYPPAA